jgi:hypothetical protein
MEIKLAKGTLRVAGNVDVVVLRTAIECLVRFGLPAGTRICHLDRRRSDRSATRFYGTQRDGADGAGRKSILGSSLHFPWDGAVI